MITIWKFTLDQINDGIVQIQIPQDARILSAGVQGSGLVVWAAVNLNAPITTRRLAIHGTGHSVKDSTAMSEFVGTVFVGSLVFHVFDLGEIGSDPDRQQDGKE